MAKKKKQQSSPFRTLLYTLFVLVIALVLYVLEQEGQLDDVETILEDFGILEETANNAVTVEEPITASGEWYQVMFTQPINSDEESDHTGAPIEQTLIAAIDGAQATIDGALFELNAPDTTAALVRAVERGVRVRFVFDDDHAYDDPESTVQDLLDVGVEAVSDERGAFMHSKFLIIDGQQVWMGSMNFTRNGMYNNNNNAILITSPAIAANYQAEFDEMFNDRIFNSRDDEGIEGEGLQNVPNPVVNIAGTEIETYFSPEQGEEVTGRIAELITNAQSSVHFMAFSFTLEDIGDVIIGRLDDENFTVGGVFEIVGSLQGQMLPLHCAGANVRQDGNPNILHHKTFIIDEQIVVTGSLNFSNNARENNSENVLIINNAEIASAYMQEWQRRFDEGRDIPPEDIAC